MKYIVLLGDGMADRRLKQLGYRTCLQYAHTPNMDFIASEGECGWVRTIPGGFEPGSDVANLSILGYDPVKYFTGRAPTLRFPSRDRWDSAVMDDYSAGHISTKDAGIFINELNGKLGGRNIAFYPGMSYRHLMVWKDGPDRVRCTPPHDITGRKIKGYLPRGKGADILNGFMMRSTDILSSHPLNRKRIKAGLPPANSLWFWGQGKQLSIPSFMKRYGLRGSMISAVDLTKGLGVCAGFNIIEVKGATGYLDTNYAGKARAAVKALQSVDFVYLHVEAPDEAGHNGDVPAKIRAIEDFDLKVVGPVLKRIGKYGDYSVLLLPDHATPIRVRSHTDDVVPFAIYRSSGRRHDSSHRGFDETICASKRSLFYPEGHALMDYFIGRRKSCC
jgi:2,3-bisphosphoglycerate-independent phosphoglycerate mutase